MKLKALGISLAVMISWLMSMVATTNADARTPPPDRPPVRWAPTTTQIGSAKAQEAYYMSFGRHTRVCSVRRCIWV